MARIPDHEMIEYRLKVWRDLSRRGLKVAEIADRLGMKRAALDQFVYRQRKAGNPLATFHPNACFADLNPSARKLAKRAATRRRDRRRTAQRTAARTV